MSAKKFKTLFALGLALSLLGCTTPLGTLVSGPEAESKGAHATLPTGVGSVSLGIRWPDASPSLQAIPNRAVKAVVTLKRADGSPAVDASGKTLAPAEIYRQPYNGYPGSYVPGFNQYGLLRWELPAQSNVTVRAEVRDEHGVVVAADERVLDIVPGVYASVSLDLVAVDAPQITSLSSTDWRVGDRIVVTGTGFGKSKGWAAYAFLEVERRYPVPFGSGYYTYPTNQMMFPTVDVSVDSDTQMTLTVPRNVIPAMASYFANRENATLRFGVSVDGVQSRRMEVSMPTEASAAVRVDLVEAPDAPPQGEVPTGTHNPLWAGDYALPVDPGTRWEYQVSSQTYRDPSQGGYSYGSSHRLSVEMLDDSLRGRYQILPDQGNSTSPMQSFQLSRWSWGGTLSSIFELSSVNAIQTLPNEPIMVPGIGERSARRYFICPEPGATREVWFVDGVGVVRTVETRVGGYFWIYESSLNPMPRQREVITHELIRFTPANTSGEG